MKELKNEDGSTTVIFNPDTPNDRLHFGIKSCFERPELGAYIRQLEIISTEGAPQIVDGRYRHAVLIKVVVDSLEPEAIEKLKKEEDITKFTQFLKDYVLNPACVTNMPQDQVAAYLKRIDANAVNVGVNVIGKSTKQIILEITAVIKQSIEFEKLEVQKNVK